MRPRPTTGLVAAALATSVLLFAIAARMDHALGESLALLLAFTPSPAAWLALAHGAARRAGDAARGAAVATGAYAVIGVFYGAVHPGYAVVAVPFWPSAFLWLDACHLGLWGCPAG